MIARSPLAKIAALLLAGGAHAALLVVLVDAEPAGIEGAGGAAEARLGTAFRDLVAGERATPPVSADATPVTAHRPHPAESVAPTRAEAAPSALPQAHEPTPAAADGGRVASGRALPRSPVAATAAAAPMRPTDPAIPVTPDAARSGVADRGTEARPAPAAPLTEQAREVSAAHAPRRPDTVLQAEPDLSPAPVRSSRPPRRPEHVLPRPAPEPTAEGARPAAAQPAAAGNAPRTETTGTATGRATAPSASSGPARAQATAGNAAASTYPGLVMRCISRAGRPRVAARGTAVVSFRVDAGGRITGVALAASSGDAGLDRAAVRTIRQAGPCPAPPPGAETAFSIRVQGR